MAKKVTLENVASIKEFMTLIKCNREDQLLNMLVVGYRVLNFLGLAH